MFVSGLLGIFLSCDGLHLWAVGGGLIYQSPPAYFYQRNPHTICCLSSHTRLPALHHNWREGKYKERKDPAKRLPIPVGLLIDSSDTWLWICLHNISLTKLFASNLNFTFIRSSASLPGDVSVLHQNVWKKKEHFKFTRVVLIFQVRVWLKYNIVSCKCWMIRRAGTESESLEMGCFSVIFAEWIWLCKSHHDSRCHILSTVGEWAPYTFTNNTRKHESEHSQCDVSIPAALAAGEPTLTQVDHRIFLTDTKLSPWQDEWSIQILFSPVIQITCCYIWIFKSFADAI